MRSELKMTVLCGGENGLRFVQALSHIADPSCLSVVINTGGEFLSGPLPVSPLYNTALQMLRRQEPASPAGRDALSYGVRDRLQELDHGVPQVELDDQNIALSLHRSMCLADGMPLHRWMAETAATLGLEIRILPMSNEQVTTFFTGPDSRCSSQEVLHRYRTSPDFEGVVYEGSETALPAPGVRQAILGADVIFIAPDSHITGIGPMLAVPGIVQALQQSNAPVLAVSAGVCSNRTARSSEDQILRHLHLESTAVAQAQCYRDFADGLVLSETDRSARQAVWELGVTPFFTDLDPSDARQAAEFAQSVLAFSGSLLGKASYTAVLPVYLPRWAQPSLPGLDQAELEHIFLSILTDMIVQMQNSRLLDRIVVVTEETSVEQHLQTHHPTVSILHKGGALDSVFTEAASNARKAGSTAMMFLFANIPLLDESCLKNAVETSHGHDIVLIPDRDLTGTNGIILNLRKLFFTSFGAESLSRHLQRCREINLDSEVLVDGKLGFNIRSPEDLRLLAHSGRIELQSVRHVRSLMKLD